MLIGRYGITKSCWYLSSHLRSRSYHGNQVLQLSSRFSKARRIRYGIFGIWVGIRGWRLSGAGSFSVRFGRAIDMRGRLGL
ncbi:hypothetical protein LOCC1_G005269 [Lachnellula occidentalis]|uniref:Uncharacterized protein n=1 Tax=Lachnellula occidentalis TaxID=215460 RepID=A0A8H8U9A8_9HELO|nr:hypothetical protein LOCC1_G005269 [Lachnellula occidentalis]